MDDPTGVVGFCQRVRPRLVGTLSLLCGDGDVAEELAQETLARVWLRWARVRELDEPLAVAWTYRVAINLGNSWLRRRVSQLRRRRAGSVVAVVALLVLLVPLGQAGLERLRQRAGVVDRPPGPAATTPARPTTVTAPTTTAPGRAVRPAPLGTPEQAFRALARLPRGWSTLPAPPEPREEAVSLWIGNGLFLWGGESRAGGHADGWVFDPVARWVKIRPKGRRGVGRIVAAGPVFLIAGAGNGGGANGLVAYNPGP